MDFDICSMHLQVRITHALTWTPTTCSAFRIHRHRLRQVRQSAPWKTLAVIVSRKRAPVH